MEELNSEKIVDVDAIKEFLVNHKAHTEKNGRKYDFNIRALNAELVAHEQSWYVDSMTIDSGACPNVKYEDEILIVENNVLSVCSKKWKSSNTLSVLEMSDAHVAFKN